VSGSVAFHCAVAVTDSSGVVTFSNTDLKATDKAKAVNEYQGMTVPAGSVVLYTSGKNQGSPVAPSSGIR
jgi:hypothetical protein